MIDKNVSKVWALPSCSRGRVGSHCRHLTHLHVWFFDELNFKLLCFVFWYQIVFEWQGYD